MYRFTVFHDGIANKQRHVRQHVRSVGNQPTVLFVRDESCFGWVRFFHCLFDYLIQIATVNNNVLFTKRGRDYRSQIIRSDETIAITVVYLE